MTSSPIHRHEMLEMQATVYLSGPLDRLLSSVSFRMGEVLMSPKNGALVQHAKSLSPSSELRLKSEAMETEIRHKMEPLNHLTGQARICGLVRDRIVTTDASNQQSFLGFWGKVDMQQKPAGVFGCFSHGPLVFRRGPWEDWGISYNPLEKCEANTPIIFSPFSATVLHEAIGHAMEAEYLAQSPLQKTYGQRVSSDQLFVMDRPDLPDLPGTMTHDDVGNPASATTLVHRGHVVGDLDSDKGVRRRGSYRDFPKIRATNLVIKGGQSDPNSWVQSLPHAIYVCWVESGKWLPGTQDLDIMAGPTYCLHKGDPVAYAPWFHMRFNTLDLLSRIVEVGNDLRWDPQVHWCVKQLQSVPISMSSPSILVEGR